MSTLKVAKGTTIEMSYTSVQQRNSETGAYANIASPNSVTFSIINQDTSTTSSTSGNQIGSTNGWYAKKTMNSTGNYTWTVTVVKDTDQVVTVPERVIVVSSTNG